MADPVPTASRLARVPALEAAPAARRISVVLPVFNERENIERCLLALEAALEGHEHEILVCYDFEEDSTLLGIAAMDRVPASVRLVRNRLGRGASNAIQSGFQVASGDVVVTTMADLCDPPEVIPELARAIREGGASVVSGSRCTKGSSQSGGPFLKQLLSRSAGLSLCWVAGIRTHDPTNNFRAYSRRYLDKVEIQSQTAFDIALELIVKAQLAGEKILELRGLPVARTATAPIPSPAGARDRERRSGGAWTSADARRCWWAAMAAPLFVLGAWGAMLARALSFVASHASAVPFFDDLVVGPMIAGFSAVDASWLWAQHNEHRIPLPKLVYAALLAATNDVRSGMIAQVAILAALALACAMVARRIRGRSSVADAFFPLLWLEVGNTENLLIGFQVSLALPVAIATGVLLAIAGGTLPLRPRAALAIAAALVALPLCGAPGLVPLAPLAAWAAWAGARASRAGERASARILVGGALASLLVTGLYAVGFERPPYQPGYADPARAFETAAQYASLALGDFAAAHWRASAALVGLFLALGLALLARCAARGEGLRAGGLLAALAGMLATAAAVGFGRGRFGETAGLALRYAVLAMPLLVWPYLVLVRCASDATRSVGCAALCLLAAAAVVPNQERGVRYARQRLAAARAVQADVARGVVLEELARRHAAALFGGRERDVLSMLATLRYARIAPFARDGRAGGTPPTVEDRSRFAFLDAAPVAVRAPAPARFVQVDGAHAAVLTLPCELVFAVPEGARTLRARVGASPEGTIPALEAALAADGGERALPVDRADPVGAWTRFEVSLPEGAAGELVLRAAGAGGDALWAEVGFVR